MEATATLENKPATWFWAAAILGIAWNVFGVVQFLAQFGATESALMGDGMTAEQAALYAAQPMWMTIAFAIGVFGGVLGSVLLLLRRRAAMAVFAASLGGYIVLYIGDITTGIFKAFGASQVMILTTVVIIAAALLALSRIGIRRNWLG